jgi:hypothetical protein
MKACAAIQRRFGGGGGGGGLVGSAPGIVHLAHPLVVTVASPCGPPTSVQVELDTQTPPVGLGAGLVSWGRLSVLMVVSWPKLAHDVVVMHTGSRGLPLHTVAVVDDRHTWPEDAVGSGGSVGRSVRPPPKPPPLIVGISESVGLSDSVGTGTGTRKSGGIPVGFGTQ